MDLGKVRRSTVWENFIVDSHNETYAICTLCGHNVFRGKCKSTTAMRRHLQLKHGKNMGIPYKKPTEHSTFNISSVYPYPNTVMPSIVPKVSKQRDAQLALRLVIMCSMECLPFDFIQSQSFSSFCSTAGISENFTIPTDDNMKSCLLGFSNQITFKISQELYVSCSYCSLTIESYPLISGSYVLQIGCYWITDNFVYKSAILGARIYNPNSASVQILSNLIQSILQPYAPITHKIIAIVVDSVSIISDSVYALISKQFLPSNVSVMICFSDTIDRLFKSILFMKTHENLDLLHFITVLHKVIDIFQNDYNLCNKWNKELKYKSISIRENDCWVCLLNSLVNLEKQWSLFQEFIKNYIPEDLKTDFYSPQFRSSLQELIDVMSPLLEIVHMSFSEKYHTISCIYPILRTCAMLFLRDPTPQDDWVLPLTHVGCELRSMIQKEFAVPWSATPNIIIPLASVLDPRYKDMVIFNEEEKKQIKEFFVKDVEFSSSKKIIPSLSNSNSNSINSNDSNSNNNSNNNGNNNRMNKTSSFSVYKALKDYKNLFSSSSSSKPTITTTTSTSTTATASAIASSTDLLSSYNVQGQELPPPLNVGVNNINQAKIDANAIVNDYFGHDVNPDDSMDVLKWWSTHKYKYDSVTSTVKKYFCIPLTSSPRDQIFSSTPNEFYNKRFKLEDSVAECCIMIRCNINDYVDEKSDFAVHAIV